LFGPVHGRPKTDLAYEILEPVGSSLLRQRIRNSVFESVTKHLSEEKMLEKHEELQLYVL
jgi:hypothetical protein